MQSHFLQLLTSYDLRLYEVGICYRICQEDNERSEPEASKNGRPWNSSINKIQKAQLEAIQGSA